MIARTAGSRAGIEPSDHGGVSAQAFYEPSLAAGLLRHALGTPRMTDLDRRATLRTRLDTVERQATALRDVLKKDVVEADELLRLLMSARASLDGFDGALPLGAVEDVPRPQT